MSIRHHPCEETMIRYAAGSLAGGAPLVVAAHVDGCAVCRREVRLLEGLGGALLDELPAAEMAPDALARMFARLEAPAGRAEVTNPPPQTRREISLLPPSLKAQSVGSRRWLAPGIWTAPICEGDASGSSTYLLRVGRRLPLPRHGHRGAEMTCVLAGSFSDQGGQYGAGDFVEMDSQQEHQPTAGPESECICVISAEGPPRIHGLAGWLFRTLTGLH